MKSLRKSVLVVSCVLAVTFLATCTTAQKARIINGQIISVATAPYIVQLTEPSGFQFCGGSLISQYHVLTASHCFNTRHPANTVIVGGVTYTYEQGGVRALISKLFKHPDYTEKTQHSDVAVIKLDRPMVGPNIAIVALCQQQLPVNGIIQVSGWGQTEAGVASRELRTTRIPVRDYNVCRQEFGDLVMRNMFCASGLQATGTCIGDSGGPALYNSQVCGIVAFGYKCGTVGSTGAFTNVLAMRPFIESCMRA